MPKRTADPTYRKNRAIILQGNPNCALCGGGGANTADHIIPYDAGGGHEVENLRPAHLKCNSKAGAAYVNKKRTQQMQTRNDSMQKQKKSQNDFFAEKTLPKFTKNDMINKCDGLHEKLIELETQYIENIEEEEFDHARALGCSRWEILWEVIIKGRMDYVMEIIRQNLAIVWMMLVTVESILVASGGLGFFIKNSDKFMNHGRIVALQLVILACGLLIDFALVKTRTILFRYSKIFNV
mgnify:CR=1 FL=1